MRSYHFIGLLLLTLMHGCTSGGDFPIEPKLTFISLSKNTMNQSALGTDNLFITLEFTDGDGDIGSDIDINLEVIDNRTGDSYDFFKVPMVPEPGANNGISGTMVLKLFNACCKEPGDPAIVCENVTVTENTFTLGISLTDRAGNKSNVVTTSPLTLVCKN